MSNSRRDGRGRFTSQKRTISANESEHVNSVVQFDEVVVDRDEFFSIGKDQDDLNESDHDDQSEDSEQRSIDQIVRDQAYDDADSPQSREFILSALEHRRGSRQPSMEFVYTSQGITSASLIIIDDSIIGKKSSDFKKLVKDHVVAHDWIDKHENYHVLNRYIIASHERVLHSKQYLVDKVVNWFNTLFDESRKEWKPFKTIFFRRWNNFNWREHALESFQRLQQFDEYSDINDFNVKFTSIYENIQELILFFVARRRYIDVLKSHIKINMKQMLFMRFQIDLNEMMSLTENFEIVNKILYAFRSFGQKRQSSNTAVASVINSKTERNLNVMIKEFKCYNCDKTGHKAFACFNEHVFDQGSSDWKSRKKKGTEKE